MHRQEGGLQPRQLDLDEFTTNDRSAKKRNADEVRQTAGSPGKQTGALPSPQAKKSRTSILRTNNPPPPPEHHEEEPVGKPDVFEYFAERANKSKDLENQIQNLKQRESTLTHNLERAQNQAALLKTETQAAEARCQALEEQLRLANDRLQNEARRAENAITSLEAEKLKAASTSAAANGAAAAAYASGRTPSALEAQQAARELKLRVSELELRLETQEQEARDAASRAHAALENERQRREGEQATVTLLQQQVEDTLATSQADAKARREAETRCMELERQLATLESLPAAGSKSNEGDAVLIRTLRERLAVAEVAAAEAKKLKEQAFNAHVLNERLQAAEARAKRAEQLTNDAEELRAKLDTAEASLRQWEMVLADTADCATPEEVLRQLKKLQAEQLAAAAALGERSSAEAALKVELEAAKQAEQAALASEAAQKAATEETAANLARAERKVTLLAQERDSLKAVLDSYDQEYLAHGGGDNESTPQRTRITQLEATIESLQEHITALEQDLATTKDSHQQATEDGLAAGTTNPAEEEAIARAETAENRLKRANAEAENLAKEIARLHSRLGRGEFDPERTQVLHMKLNPESEARRIALENQIAHLESENEALKENITRIEAAMAAGQGGGAVPAIDAGLRVAQLESELNLMRRKIAETRKASDRLQQVFTKQIALLREALVALFGYRVEMNVDPASKEHKAQFVLRPQNADEPGAELSFCMMRDGRMVLIPTEYSRRKLKVEVETFIERFKSIPALTANLTMELFQRQTQN